MSQLSLFDHAATCRKSDSPTSKESAKTVEPKLAGLRVEFVRRLREIGEPSTANEVAGGNESLRKRAKECVELGLVNVLGTKCCRVTGQKAAIYWIR